uniref:Ig-like domain-containing protein n=1 Tax=Echeneis naucrates TaxID=173247 RepID=A0A665U333_ECHNA
SLSLSLSLSVCLCLSVCLSLSVCLLTAELGDDVTLKCNVTNKGNIIVVEWTRPDLHPEYVFLYRDGRSYPDKQNPSFKERVKLEKTDIRDGDVSLILENVKTTDSGTYECRVFQRGTNSKKKRNTDSIRTIKLKVYQKGESVKSRLKWILFSHHLPDC